MAALLPYQDEDTPAGKNTRVSTALVLASASPRRRELLARLGAPFRVVVPGVDEGSVLWKGASEETARRLAEAKAREVAERYPRALVVGADTLVVDRWGVLGKPREASEARRILRRLRGRRHRVVTAIAVVRLAPSLDMVSHVVSRVVMRPYTDAEIAAYVSSGDPLDKAGAYGVQHPVFAPAAAVEGCYCNVVGLPLLRLARALGRAGLRLLPLHRLSLPGPCARCPDRALWDEA